MSPTSTARSARFDLAAIAAALPETAATLLVDTYLTDREAASARVFRVYKGTPPHYHATCDEYLYVLSGRGTFWMEDPATAAEFGPGQLLFFERGTVHALPEILAEPVVFLSVDTPRRPPADIVFVNPGDGSPETFMARNAP
ncbi:MAG: cupin domain-containing protein [Methylobacterium frigidaeris]